MYQQHLVAFAVDEAHCVSKWLVGMYLLSILVENVQFKLVLSITVYGLTYRISSIGCPPPQIVAILE